MNKQSQKEGDQMGKILEDGKTRLIPEIDANGLTLSVQETNDLSSVNTLVLGHSGSGRRYWAKKSKEEQLANEQGEL